MLKQWKQLTSISPRAEWVDQNREVLMSHIRSQAAQEPVAMGFFETVRFWGRATTRPTIHPSAVMLSMLLLFVGGSLVINAAFYALPGDSLYTLKLTLEQTQVAITPQAEKKVELHIQFAKNRLAELDKIVQQPTTPARKEQVAAVVKELKKNVTNVQEQISSITQPVVSAELADKQATIKMAMTVKSQTADLVKTLNDTASQVTVEDQVIVEGQDNVQSLVGEAVAAVKETVDTVDQAVNTAVEQEATVDPVAPGQNADTTNSVIVDPAAATGTIPLDQNQKQNSTTVPEEH